jgi:hypothetical protein
MKWAGRGEEGRSKQGKDQRHRPVCGGRWLYKQNEWKNTRNKEQGLSSVRGHSHTSNDFYYLTKSFCMAVRPMTLL